MPWLRATAVILGVTVNAAACSSDQTGSRDQTTSGDVNNAETAGSGSPGLTDWAGNATGVPNATSPDTTFACVNDLVACTFSNRGNSTACLDEASACGLPSPEGIAACTEAMFACAQGSPLDYHRCVSEADACRTSDAIALWHAGADLATESSEFAVSVPIAFLTAIGTALKPLGVKFIFDAVANVLCVVPQIVRCSTLSDYVQCVQSNPGHPEACASRAAECGFSSMDQVALASAAECADTLSQCPGSFATCAASNSACNQFDPLELASAELGVATKSASDILLALLPVLRFEESEFQGCQCAEEYSECVAQAAPEDVAACAVAASTCSSDGPPGGPPITPPPPSTPMFPGGAPD